MALVLNRTIDDQFGDSVTGALPIYRTQNSTVVWNVGATCTQCAFHPDPELAFDRTWHDSSQFPGASGPVSVALNFTGTAIEVFCIAPPLTTNAIKDYHLNFTPDGGTRHGTFSYGPSSSTQFVYNLSVVALQGLENGTHELVVSTDDSDCSCYAGIQVQFVQAHTSAGTIVGSVLGAIFVILWFLVFLFLRRRGMMKRKSVLLPMVQPFVGRQTRAGDSASNLSPSPTPAGSDLATSPTTTTTQSVSNTSITAHTSVPLDSESRGGSTTPPPVYESINLQLSDSKSR